MFTREMVKQLHEEINEAAKLIAEKHGLGFMPASSTFSETEARFGFTFETTNANGETRLEADYKQFCETFGLKPEWLHRQFDDGSRKLEIVGLDMNKTKNVVILKEVGSDRQYKAPANYVIRALA